MKKNAKKLLCYLLGLLTISLGINISKLSALGISPVSAIPRACERIWGMTLGTTTMIVYIVLVLLQLVLLRRKFKPTRVLQLALTVVFGWMVDFTGSDPNAFGHLMLNFPRPGSYVMQLVYALVGVVVIGIGVTLYLRPHWITLPAEGISDAVATVTGKPFGNCKSVVDTSMVMIALVMQLIFLGGFSSFADPQVVVREGTVIAAVCIGQVVKVLTKKFGARIEAWIER